MMKKYLRIVLIVLLIVATISILLFYMLPKRFDPQNATRLTVFVGSTGEKIEITDRDTIEEISESITTNSFRRGKRAYIDGFRYTLTWYDESGNSLLSLSLLGDSDKLIYNGRFYHVKGDAAINHAPIDALLEQN